MIGYYEGEFMVILEPSGSGKSTLVNKDCLALAISETSWVYWFWRA
jgi:ABC-type lipoprotein export system ATPase subunit